MSFFLEQNKGIDAYGYFYLSHNYVDYTFDFTDNEHKFILGNGTNNIIYLSRIFNSLFFSSFFIQTILFSSFGLVGIYFVYKNILSFGFKSKLYATNWDEKSCISNNPFLNSLVLNKLTLFGRTKQERYPCRVFSCLFFCFSDFR